MRDSTLYEPQAYFEYRQNQPPLFFFTPNQRPTFHSYFAAWDNTPITPCVLSTALAKGELRYFEKTTAQVGFPPNWHRNPFTGQSSPDDCHWSQIGDFGFGDIKVIWEPSRFAFTFALVRSYWRTGDNCLAEYFWQLIEDWAEKNPPNQGANWKCGQEISFRLMAWCFGLYGFLAAPATTPERIALLTRMIYVSGIRIEANLQYALSQRNNHGISEGVGLWTIGTLFPELQKAKNWQEAGRTVLESQGRELIYDDGAFSQHSMNYHRVMLQDYLWVIRLAAIQNTPFSKELRSRIAAAGNFLYQLQDTETGQMPNYGQNDGALILPLNNCDYQDYRPIIQSIHYLATGEPCYAPGPWDEDLLWMFGAEALTKANQACPRKNLQADIGGYYTLRSTTGFVFLRCANFQDRPGQADMLHVDLWWKGQNIALDAGTYSYNTSPPWNNALARTGVHNTANVSALDQMEQRGKFLWLPWLQSRIIQNSTSDEISFIEGEHNGYQRLKPAVIHRRGVIQLGEDTWIVVDRLSSIDPQKYILHWLFPDLPYRWTDGILVLDTSSGPYTIQMQSLLGKCQYSLVRADKESVQGWQSKYYFHREPALSVDLSLQAQIGIFWTLFSPRTPQIKSQDLSLEIGLADKTVSIKLSTHDLLIEKVSANR